MKDKQPHWEWDQTKKTAFFITDRQGQTIQQQGLQSLALQFVTETNGERQSGVSYDEKSAVQDRNEDAAARVFQYDYGLLPLTKKQRWLLNEISAEAPVPVWDFVDKYLTLSHEYRSRHEHRRRCWSYTYWKRCQSYVYERIERLCLMGLLALKYDGPRGEMRAHVSKLLVRPGEIWVVPNGELVAWRQGDMWHIKAKWIAVRHGHKRITFALPLEVLKVAELPMALYVAATYEKTEPICFESKFHDARYLVATPSAEMTKAFRAQTDLANLGDIDTPSDEIVEAFEAQTALANLGDDEDR